MKTQYDFWYWNNDLPKVSVGLKTLNEHFKKQGANWTARKSRNEKLFLTQ